LRNNQESRGDIGLPPEKTGETATGGSLAFWFKMKFKFKFIWKAQALKPGGDFNFNFNLNSREA
jgi:hypothetical protein